MIPIRTVRFAVVAAALLTGITGFAAVPAPAGHAAGRQPPAAPAATGVTTLTLGNGTRAVMAAPWAGSAGHTDMVSNFAGPLNRFCLYGVAQSHGPQVAPAPAVPKYTLTIKGRNLAGAPAGIPDEVQVYSATSIRWDENNVGPIPVFRHGVVTMHVPAGKYWLIGMFPTRDSLRMDIPSQVTVTGNTTATVSARAASSEVRATTPRRAVLANAIFSSSYTLPGGQVYEDCGTFDGAQIWVSPHPRSHTTGTLYSATSAQLNSPPGEKAPYTYEVDSLAPPGTIASQHLTVTSAGLATAHEHLYSDTATTAPWLALGGPARQYTETGFTAASTTLPMPGDRTVYFQAQPSAVWRPKAGYGTLLQTSTWQLLRAGQEVSTNWNAYPLHPAPNLAPAGVTEPTVPTASRTGNKLLLDVTPFSDNTPGHMGSGISRFNGIKGSGTYAIYANGVKIAGGPVNTISLGDVGATATLSPRPSRIGFTLTTSRQGPGSNLSGTSTDAWTWPSRPEPHALAPAPWDCGAKFINGRIVYDRHCAVQDMMTLDYRLAHEGLDGSTPAGPQSLGIAINHLPLSTPYPVTRAQLQVSFDNGASWRPATLTRICHGQVCTNTYRASYPAPAGVQVSLRLTARDTNGATVTETILGAYQTA